MLLGKIFIFIQRFINFCIKKYNKTLFKTCGSEVYIGNHCTFTYGTVSIGNDVYIGQNACFQSTHGEIIIGNHVMFGPGVHIHGGNHKMREIGKLMKEIKKSDDDYDGKVIIKDDVWVGANAIILKGVTVGEGSVIGAGAIVTEDVPEYSIYTGVPEKKIIPRFTSKQIKEHEDILRKRGLKK